MKKSVIAILLSIMMISGSIGAVPVFASQPPAVQEAADILTEEYGFSPGGWIIHRGDPGSCG